MHTKHYFTAIFIIALTLLAGFSGKAQNSSDTIRVEKRGMGDIYYKDNVMLSFRAVQNIIKENKKAYYLMESSKNMRIVSYGLGIAGGFCIGYPLGYLLGRLVSGNTGNPINKVKFYAFLGAGVALTGISIGLEIGAKNKVSSAVEIYNQSKRERNVNLNVGLLSNGVNLKLSF